MPKDGLESMLPPVASWFRRELGKPTPPQREGWPVIASGSNALILAPTGSGKTLSAFLAALDHLWRNPAPAKGTRILYISPLKALNYDIARNLHMPLRGVLEESERMGIPLPALRVGVRTGDTPQSERQAMVRRPPDILITTPESLHLMLTSGARKILKTLSHVIIDEIHALFPNKRGSFLALLLERLEGEIGRPFVRIGLSATQKPLGEVARFLGGNDEDGEPRPVTIVDTGKRKELNLEVVPAVQRFGPLPEKSIWPSIERRLVGWIGENRSTLVFANNRRVAERLTAHLNEKMEEQGGEPLVRSHHGSLSLEERRETEDGLKAGALKAVVATASLEMGIDMGSVDLVCQVESPGSVARALQRVGRAGHVVGAASAGKLIAKDAGDLLEAAALTRAMIRGEIETSRAPSNPLDVLAQQVVACVAVRPWPVRELYELIRRAYPYRDLSERAFERVVELVSGRYAVESLRDLRPRVSWDRVRNVLHPLPGTAHLAISGGGTIPDTGQYPAYLGDGGPRLGELDEEFVLERRVGETFLLGTNTWKIEAIEPHRVLVSRAEGQAAVVPFWRGEAGSRTPELGEAIGALTRTIAEAPDAPGTRELLAEECRVSEEGVDNLLAHIRRQGRHSGAVPDDRTVIVETFRDQAGELGLAILTPFGGRLHHGLKLALTARLRERLGVQLACLHADDGILFRLPGMDEFPHDPFAGLDADMAERLIREEIGDSALFGLRFRQAAGRALLMPKPDPTKRTPLWLQRLRAKDLLQVARQFPDFPIVIEAYRECLDDDLDLGRLRGFLDRLNAGEIRVARHDGEVASPFASELLFRFQANFMYEWDQPKQPKPREHHPKARNSDPLTSDLLDDVAVRRLDERLRGGLPRSAPEMAEHLRSVGDLSVDETPGVMLTFLAELEADEIARRIQLAREERWILAEEAETYRAAFADPPDLDARDAILRRYLRTHALVGLPDLTARYPIAEFEAADWLLRQSLLGHASKLEDGSDLFADPQNLSEARRFTLALQRKEAIAVTPEVFADYLLWRQGARADVRREGSAMVAAAIERLQGHVAPASAWEAELLPRRVKDFRPAWLDAALVEGGWTWRALPREAGGDDFVALLPRGFEGSWPNRDGASVPDEESRVADWLSRRGASFLDEISSGLGIEPSRARAALAGLVRRGEASNDRFDPLRPGPQSLAEANASSSASARGRISLRQRSTPGPQGRWYLVPPGSPDPEAAATAWAAVLLDRYGILAREVAGLEPAAPPWRELSGVLDRAEWRGEVRRGFFVEGLSGAQYATPEAAEELARHAPSPEPTMIAAADPANPYGSSGLFDIPLVDGGKGRLLRTFTNFVALSSGRPILIVEGLGRRLTIPGSASEAEIRPALRLLTALAGPTRRTLKVEAIDGLPALDSPAAAWLIEAGFVRDFPGLAYYHLGL